MITLTERAAKEIRRIFDEHKMSDGGALRIGIKGGGCSGFSYTLGVSDKPAEDDVVYQTNGVRLVTDPKSNLYLDGTEIDFRDELLNRGFVFNNPNAKNSCSCGSSFSA
jgi:iron-sulfur cluster assembly protein